MLRAIILSAFHHAVSENGGRSAVNGHVMQTGSNISKLAATTSAMLSLAFVASSSVK